MLLLTFPSTELNCNLFTGLQVKLFFSVFYVTRFHNFFPDFKVLAPFKQLFLVLSHYHITNSPHITLLASQKSTIENMKVLKGIDYGFNGFDTPLSKNLNVFLQLSLTFSFTLSFYSYEINWIMTVLLDISWRNKLDFVLMAFMTLKTIVFENSKTLLTLFKFAFLFFLDKSIPSIVNTWSHMTLSLLTKGAIAENLMVLSKSFIEFTGFSLKLN